MSSASSIASRGCNGVLVDLSSKSNQQQSASSAAAASAASAEQKRISLPPPLYRSRTDSVITYTPPSIGEAPGSTFYIRKNGQIDYLVLLKALHKISLRENVCTVRVCEVLLSLASTLIDLGVLANNAKA